MCMHSVSAAPGRTLAAVGSGGRLEAADGHVVVLFCGVQRALAVFGLHALDVVRHLGSKMQSFRKTLDCHRGMFCASARPQLVFYPTLPCPPPTPTPTYVQFARVR